MNQSNINYQDALGYLIGRTGRTMGKSLRCIFARNGMEMPVEHWGLLVQLWAKDGQGQQELADLIFKDKATITRALDHLEGLGVVKRVPSEHDKRHKLIYLTSKGHELKNILWPLAAEMTETAVKGIPAKDIETCKKVLNKIHQNLNP